MQATNSVHGSARRLSLVLLLTIALIAPSTVLAAPLFELGGAMTKAEDAPGMLARHAIELDSKLLGGEWPRPEKTAETFQLPLPNGKVVTAERGEAIRNASGSVSWIGKVRGDLLSSVVLVSKAGVTVGSIRTGGELFMVMPQAGGGMALETMDEASPMLQEFEPTPVDLTKAEMAAAAKSFRPEPVTLGTGNTSKGASGTLYQDLMVVYTATAASGAGGTIAIQNLIDLGVTETNLSYSQSEINHRLRLVHTREVAYNESGSAGLDRDRLRINGDGFMDEVHDWRNTYSADLVKLIINSGGCGIAYIMNPVSPAFEAFGFCVTARFCVSPNYTFAHELGHIQAARHDYFVDPTTNAPFAFNHGYTDPNNQWRTVMAYSNGCGGCQRQLYWSNPDGNHPSNGNAMGIPDGQPQAADNRLTLNTTADVVAGFRNSGFFGDGFESGDTTSWTSVAP